MDEDIASWLSNFSAAAFSDAFRERGWETVGDLVESQITERQLLQLGMTTLWIRKAVLSAIAKAAQDERLNRDDDWADFGDGDDASAATDADLHSASMRSDTSTLGDLLGGEHWVTESAPAPAPVRPAPQARAQISRGRVSSAFEHGLVEGVDEAVAAPPPAQVGRDRPRG